MTFLTDVFGSIHHASADEKLLPTHHKPLSGHKAMRIASSSAMVLLSALLGGRYMVRSFTIHRAVGRRSLALSAKGELNKSWKSDV